MQTVPCSNKYGRNSRTSIGLSCYEDSEVNIASDDTVSVVTILAATKSWLVRSLGGDAASRMRAGVWLAGAAPVPELTGRVRSDGGSVTPETS